jgi:hypothetical protein
VLRGAGCAEAGVEAAVEAAVEAEVEADGGDQPLPAL